MGVFGLNKAEVEEIVAEQLRRKLKTSGSPGASELAQEALRLMLEKADPKEFLNNLLRTQGLTLEALVREQVKAQLDEESVLPDKDEITEGVVERVTDMVWDELDMDAFYAVLAERCVARLVKENTSQGS